MNGMGALSTWISSDGANHETSAFVSTVAVIGPNFYSGGEGSRFSDQIFSIYPACQLQVALIEPTVRRPHHRCLI